jgi:Holin of 3TMs, for gene-transfer release
MAFGIDDAIAAGLQVLNKFVPDPAAKAQAEAELRSSLQLWDKAQTDVNAVEAANPNIFVSGWRPMIGWIGAAGLAYQYVFRPLAVGFGVAGLPPLDGSLMELVVGLLGFGGMRSWEKYKGLTK